MSDPDIDPGVAYAGEQFRIWREKHRSPRITRRGLYAEKLISPKALADFEAGKSWPRTKMRAALEARVGLPPGKIDEWRVAGRDIGSRTAIVPTQDLMVSAIQVAVSAVASGAASVPPPTDEGYWPVVVASLRELRKLDSTITAAARVTPTAEVLGALRTVRRIFDQLVRAAAVDRPGEFGPQLYVTRTGAQMSTDEATEVANAAHLVAADGTLVEKITEAEISAVEACQVQPHPRVQALLDQLQA
ncbi:hypothetical protein ONA92_26240 [Mycobacteroides salmoniphilum]|uniref:hypothetical protein n=1 Tax=Mycobacteroides salmoniphilum TaxID=404941 RepID=UPI0035687154